MFTKKYWVSDDPSREPGATISLLNRSNYDVYVTVRTRFGPFLSGCSYPFSDVSMRLKATPHSSHEDVCDELVELMIVEGCQVAERDLRGAWRIASAKPPKTETWRSHDLGDVAKWARVHRFAVAIPANGAASRGSMVPTSVSGLPGSWHVIEFS